MKVELNVCYWVESNLHLEAAFSLAYYHKYMRVCPTHIHSVASMKRSLSLNYVTQGHDAEGSTRPSPADAAGALVGGMYRNSSFFCSPVSVLPNFNFQLIIHVI